ncbi:hypothetical protein DLAC_10514 [Tieghemostelium lacteum]|uniref:Uncharacterized protein n=1 Tax=Tieghemostelium lacteum TaxID=361077 RepID=A0A151Z4N6_TIELA|nr:hypothetical protein DLAC_10514 [Tieghemostelium lacteum]|eukprot:KYQ88932.1 hypothetical protein DLAC_10514 [Tieghemostelium lacteum]
MGRKLYHQYHVHHKRHSFSNCCIGANLCVFLGFLIAGAIVTGVTLVPSVEYQTQWDKINCTIVSTSLEQVCQSSECKESSNQFKFPYYFYSGTGDSKKSFPYEYDAEDTPTGHDDTVQPPNTCPSGKTTQCFNGTINFNYPINSTYISSQSLYVYGSFDNANDFTHYITTNTSTFHCWMLTSNTTTVSIIPIPKYSPAAAITTGVLFSFSLLALIILLVLISIRCFCKSTTHSSDGYQTIPYQI